MLANYIFFNLKHYRALLLHYFFLPVLIIDQIVDFKVNLANIHAKNGRGSMSKINSLPFACCNVRLQNPLNFSQVRFPLLYHDPLVRPPFVNNTNFSTKS